jgi:hypothetical protein
MKEHTDQEWTKHGDELDSGAVQYGAGPVTGYEIDLAFRDNGKGMKSWTEGTEFFRDRFEDEGGDNNSSGTGFGLRDMQFSFDKPLTQEEFNLVVSEAKKEGIVLEYMNQHGINEWGEQAIDDTDFDYGYSTEEV